MIFGCVQFVCIFIFLVNLSLFIDFTNAFHSQRHKRQTPCIKDQEFRCRNGQCIDKSLVCDGVVDCADTSDETLDICHDLDCPRYGFRCEYGACVDGTAKCDGRFDCADKSDESLMRCPYYSLPETCKTSEFQCFSGQCIESELQCDGKRDCSDGTDETYLGCQSMPCDTKRFFQCDYGACIDKRFRCNGRNDCVDGSDESPRICSNNKTTAPTVSIPSYPTPTKTSVATPKKTPPSQATRPTQTSTSMTTPLPELNEGSCSEIPPSDDKIILYQCKKKSGKACYDGEKSVKETTVAKFSCTSKYLPDKDEEMLAICADGKWIYSGPTCRRICDKLNRVNVDLTCFREGSTIDCGENLVAGTKIRPICKPLHRPAGEPPVYPDMTCLEDGSWDSRLFSCVPICGRPYTTATTLIVHGTKENYGDSPWHVAIYNQNKTLICGGTIIHPYLVLSAAHCFHDRMNNIKLSAANYEVVVSKVTRSYSVIDNDSQKVHKIKEILFSPRGYNANKDYFANDIVILILYQKITITSTVLPACVDWIHRPGDKYQPADGTLGKVSGWGMNEYGKYNESLFGANLPYISREKCINTVPYDFQPFITSDKFCAGTESGSGVLQGDSGGGLLFKEYDFYYIRGIVSLKQPTKTALAAFTDLVEHVEWIAAVRARVEQEVSKQDTISIRG